MLLDSVSHNKNCITRKQCLEGPTVHIFISPDIDHLRGRKTTHIVSTQWTLPAHVWPMTVCDWLIEKGVPQQLMPWQLTEQWPPRIALPCSCSLARWAQLCRVGGAFAQLTDRQTWLSRSSPSARDCVWSSHFAVHTVRACDASWQPPLTATGWPVWPLNPQWLTSVSLSVPCIDWPAKWPLLVVRHIFKTSLKWRVYTNAIAPIHFKLLQTLLLLLHLFNGLFSRTTWVSWYQKGKTSLDLNEARDGGVFGSQWHQLDNMQTICTTLQTDDHTNTSSLNFYRPDALPDAQPTVSKHWRQTLLQNSKLNSASWIK